MSWWSIVLVGVFIRWCVNSGVNDFIGEVSKNAILALIRLANQSGANLYLKILHVFSRMICSVIFYTVCECRVNYEHLTRVYIYLDKRSQFWSIYNAVTSGSADRDNNKGRHQTLLLRLGTSTLPKTEPRGELKTEKGKLNSNERADD